MKIDTIADVASEVHLVGYDEHGHAVASELAHHNEHLAHELRVERRRHLVEEHHVRVIIRARAIATRCCCPPES